jgi:TPR repeat protein
MNRFNRFVSLNFAAFLTLSAAGAFAASTEAAVNSGACFIAADKGKSLVQASCDVLALHDAAKDSQVYAQNQLGLVSALVVAQGTDIREARSWFEKAARHGYAPRPGQSGGDLHERLGRVTELRRRP